MATNSYQMLGDFTKDPDPDSISISPFWVVVIIPFAKTLSVDRSLVFAGESSVSESISTGDIVKTGEPLILTDSVQAMSVNHGKDSHVSGLQATLFNDNDYLAKINPGDWVMAWIINSVQDAPALLTKIKNFGAANDFQDGLKFVGRVQSIRKNLQQAPDGTRAVRFSLNAGGFHELDTSIFYDQALAEEQEDIGDFLAKLNHNLEQVYDTADGGISTTKMLPILLKILVGEGVAARTASPGGIQIVTGLTSTDEAPYAYMIPPQVARLLGKGSLVGAVTGYDHILELLLGVQKYSGGTDYKVFAPNGATATDENFRILNDNLLGTFMPLPVAFDSKSIWSILGQFLNPAVNEMYTALRVNPKGQIVPTLVVRQKPFSTPQAVGYLGNEATAFHELPRWVAAPILINSLDVGKSDALRFNFIHIYGAAAGEGGLTLTEQIVKNPPIRDDTDIKRHGLRPYMQSVPCGISDTLSAPQKWMELIADFLIGQQLALTGTCSLIGIQAPITPGDNFEFDDTIYHIEGVAHSCSISAQGQKTFTTSLTLTHGLRSKATTSTPIYPGQVAGDNTTYDPKVTVDRSPDAPTVIAGDAGTEPGAA